MIRDRVRISIWMGAAIKRKVRRQVLNSHKVVFWFY
jgi:hypothetical protein